MTSPDAKRFETRVILTFTWSPGLVFGTKTTRPSTRAMPSPRLLISLMSTSYSLPSSTGWVQTGYRRQSRRCCLLFFRNSFAFSTSDFRTFYPFLRLLREKSAVVTKRPPDVLRHINLETSQHLIAI